MWREKKREEEYWTGWTILTEPADYREEWLASPGNISGDTARGSAVPQGREDLLAGPDWRPDDVVDQGHHGRPELLTAGVHVAVGWADDLRLRLEPEATQHDRGGVGHRPLRRGDGVVDLPLRGLDQDRVVDGGDHGDPATQGRVDGQPQHL